MAQVKGSKRSKGRRRALLALRLPRWWRLTLIFCVLVLAGLLWLVWPFWRMSSQFEVHRETEPARLYGAALELRDGEAASLDQVVAELERLGYREQTSAPTRAGRYRAGDGGLDIMLRRSPNLRGWRPEAKVRATFRGGRVATLEVDQKALPALTLDPPELGTWFAEAREDRRPIAGELPETLVHAVLAAEDRNYFDHGGLSPFGILRALWVNLRQGEVRQGGSTITQQLVKNLFLTQERTFGRKAREAVLAVLVDWRYDKETILRAYLNEIYLGRHGSTHLVGFGAAAWDLFGCQPAALDLADAALLAGMIQAPNRLDPRRHPEAAVERRDWVLGEMEKLEWASAEEVEAATAVAPRLRPDDEGTAAGGYVLEATRREVAERFAQEELETAGLAVLTSLDPELQSAARDSLRWGLERQAKRRKIEELQGAIGAVDPASGAILAYVGGRDYAASQFDRLGQAQRQPGSAFKPILVASAFEQRVATPATRLEDAPLSLRFDGRTWEPRNADRKFRGWITVRRMLEESVNVPAVRLGQKAGWDNVQALGRELGLTTPLPALPSMALGALEVRPIELLGAYAALANGGVRRELHFVDAVLARDGKPVAGRAPASHQALDAETAFLVTALLQGVIDRGTASAARFAGLSEPLAGKTGTSSEGRDAWFVGYAPDRAALVWVGEDSGGDSGLSGSGTALPIWARFMARTRPAGGYRGAVPPPGVVAALIDSESGYIATPECPRVHSEFFYRGATPEYYCPLHGYFGRRAPDDEGLDDQRQEPDDENRRSWLRRLFNNTKWQ